MARSRDISKVLSSNTTLATDAEVSATYQTKAAAGLTLLTPASIANTGGSGSISSTGAVSFTSASAISLNDVFSATYENYKIVFTANGGDFNDFFFRIRVAGADLTSSTYTTVTSTTTTTTSINIGGMESRGGVGYFDIFRPFATDYTHLIARGSSLRSTGKWDLWNNYAGAVNNATSYTGFTLYPTSSTITGTIRVYGYNN